MDDFDWWKVYIVALLAFAIIYMIGMARAAWNFGLRAAGIKDELPCFSGVSRHCFRTL